MFFFFIYCFNSIKNPFESNISDLKKFLIKNKEILIKVYGKEEIERIV